jgi:hypothetical protein
VSGELKSLIQDICSYNVEQSRGEDKHNIITITMHEKRLSVQEAIDVVGYDFQSLVARFVAIQKSHLGIWNDDMKFYVRGLGNWVTGNYEWSHENVRYRLGEEVRKTGVVELLPRRIGL